MGKEDSLEFDRAAEEAMALKSKTNKQTIANDAKAEKKSPVTG